MKFLFKRSLLILILFTTIYSCDTEQKDISAEPPNIIFFIADDMYPEMFNTRPEGKGKNLTPNLDRLASEGVFMTNQRVVSPVCTPSRYNCLTGNYASRATNGRFVNDTKKNEGQTAVQFNSYITPGKEKTIGHYLQELGYKTGFVGKNHVVESPDQIDDTEKPDLNADPNDPEVKAGLERRHKSLQEDIKKCGFDFADNLYHNNPNWLGIKALASHNMDWIAEGGLRFLETYKEEPTFLYFATTLPHGPLNPENSYNADPRITAKGYLDRPLNVLPARETLSTRINEAGLEGRSLTNLLWLDDALGALLAKLEETGKIDNTIIIFFTDHGQHNKGTLYEGGVRSQSIVWRSSGFNCGSTNGSLVSNIDFMPTILDFAGYETPDSICDGRSFKAALEGEADTRRESTYHELGFARAVVKGNFKYLTLNYPEYAQNATPKERKKMLDDYNELRRSFGGQPTNLDPTLPYGHLELYPGGGGAESATFGTKPAFFESDQLYNLGTDPDEEMNLAKDPNFAEKLAEMQDELKIYLNSLPGAFGELKKE